MGNLTKTQEESQKVSPFPAGEDKAAGSKQDSMTKANATFILDLGAIPRNNKDRNIMKFSINEVSKEWQENNWVTTSDICTIADL